MLTHTDWLLMGDQKGHNWQMVRQKYKIIVQELITISTVPLRLKM